jgi:hypothetical protein
MVKLQACSRTTVWSAPCAGDHCWACQWCLVPEDLILPLSSAHSSYVISCLTLAAFTQSTTGVVGCAGSHINQKPPTWVFCLLQPTSLPAGVTQNSPTAWPRAATPTALPACVPCWTVPPATTASLHTAVRGAAPTYQPRCHRPAVASLSVGWDVQGRLQGVCAGPARGVGLLPVTRLPTGEITLGWSLFRSESQWMMMSRCFDLTVSSSFQIPSKSSCRIQAPQMTHVTHAHCVRSEGTTPCGQARKHTLSSHCLTCMPAYAACVPRHMCHGMQVYRMGGAHVPV